MAGSVVDNHGLYSFDVFDHGVLVCSLFVKCMTRTYELYQIRIRDSFIICTNKHKHNSLLPMLYVTNNHTSICEHRSI